MRKTKVCINPSCKSKGKRQSLSLFKPEPKNRSGYSGKCKTCIYTENNNLVHGTRVKRLSNDEWLIDFVKYKLGLNGFVFFDNGYEYVRSSNDRSWLERTVRNG